MTDSPKPEETGKLLAELQAQAADRGYNLNPDIEFTRDLVEALVINTRRYGYRSCPCRLADGDRTKDRDIICPCVYSVPDIEEYGSCYCNLYVSTDWNEGKIPHEYVPERRPLEKMPF